MNRMTKGAALCAVLGAMAAMVACRDGPGGDRVAGPSALREGTVLRGTVVDSLAPVGWRLPEHLPPASRRPFAETVLRGRATVDGAALATSRGLGVARHEANLTDSLGRPARVVVEAPGAGQPVNRVSVYREGSLLAEATLEWRRVAGGWVLARRVLTVYDDGRPILRHVRDAETSAGLAAATARPGRGSALAAAGGWLLPTPAEAQIPFRCWDEAAMTVVATAAVAAATAAVIATPTPATVGALTMAIAFYDKTMDAYIVCLNTEELLE
jgi:hypothetical protein